MTRPAPGTLLHTIGLRHVEEIQAFGIVFFTFFLLYIRWNYYYSATEAWTTTIAWLALLGTFCWYCATIVHNSIHVPPFTNKNWNNAWQYALCLTYGFPISTLIPGHNLSHHKYTQGVKDVIRTDKMRFSWNFINLLFFVPITWPSIVEQDNAYMYTMYKRGAPIFYQCVREIVWTVAWQIFYAYVGGVRKYATIIFFPQLFAKWGIISINLFQHDGCPDPEDDLYNMSRNFTSDLLNFFVCNNGYHTAHHIYPGTHWSEYKRIHEAEINPKMNENLNEPSILWFIVRHFILPGGRRAHDGTPYVLPPLRKDEPWFSDNITSETYSDGMKLNE